MVVIGPFQLPSQPPVPVSIIANKLLPTPTQLPVSSSRFLQVTYSYQVPVQWLELPQQKSLVLTRPSTLGPWAPGHLPVGFEAWHPHGSGQRRRRGHGARRHRRVDDAHGGSGRHQHRRCGPWVFLMALTIKKWRFYMVSLS